MRAKQQEFLRKLRSGEPCRMSAVSFTEASVAVLRLWGVAGTETLHRLIRGIPIRVENVDASLAMLAYEAYREFGKGFHPARLNLGDCFSYALAKQTGERLLFKGDDFGQTDVGIA